MESTLPKTADAVVIGGGAIGAATAWYLEKYGVKKVILLERGEILSGSTGRCAGGFRHQFPTVPECLMAKDSLAKIAVLQEELNEDFEYNKGGYLVLSYTEKDAEEAKKKIAMQNQLGIRVRWMEPDEIEQMAPWINRSEGYLGAAWGPDDGMVNPFKFTLAFIHAFQRKGGMVFCHTPVVSIHHHAGTFDVGTSSGSVNTPLLFNCTGAYSRRIGDMLGIDIPVTPLAREKIVTEPLKPLQPFLCNSPRHVLHFNQTKNGNFLMSCANLSIRQRTDLKNTWLFAQETAEAVRRLVPALGKVKILRQWAGFYETTPDGKPLIGSFDGLDGYEMAVGFNGHGMMMAPGAGSAIVKQALGEPVPDWFDSFPTTRFAAETRMTVRAV